VEPLALQSALEVEHRPVDVVEAGGVDEHPQAVVLPDGVVLFGFVVEAHTVREARTAALLDEQSKSGHVGVHVLAF